MFQNQLMSVQQVAKTLCASVSGVWAKAASDDSFPKPFNPSVKPTRWKLNDVNAYIEMKAAATLH